MENGTEAHFRWRYRQDETELQFRPGNLSAKAFSFSSATQNTGTIPNKMRLAKTKLFSCSFWDSIGLRTILTFNENETSIVLGFVWKNGSRYLCKVAG